MPEGIAMMLALIRYLDDYVAALAQCLDEPQCIDRLVYAQRLATAEEMRAALADGDMGRAASLLNAERRDIGRLGFYGPGSEVVAEMFSRYAAALQHARLADRADAG